MNDIEMIQKDFGGLIEGIKSGVEKDILLRQANAISQNYVDYVKTILSFDQEKDDLN